MAKSKTTPALKKAAKRVSTGKKTTPKPPTPKKHGEKRKLHINEVVTKLNSAVKDTHIPGVDNIVPKLLGVCKFNQQIIKELLNDAQQTHIGNQVAEELFFTALKIEHYAKDTLRRVLIKSKKTDQEDVDFLNQVYRIDADFFCKVEPYKKRAYKKSQSSKDKVKQQNARRVSQLEILIGDQERQMRAIYKRIPTMAQKEKAAKKAYFKATSDFRKEYPIEDQDDIESVPQYEKWLNENTAKERGAWEAEKKLLKAKEKEYKTLQAEVEKHKKELKDSGLAEYEEDSGGGDDELDYTGGAADDADDSSGDFAAPATPIPPADESESEEEEEASDSDSDSSDDESKTQLEN